MEEKRPGLVIASDASDSFFADLVGPIARHPCSEEDARKMTQEALAAGQGVVFAPRPHFLSLDQLLGCGCYSYLNNVWGLNLRQINLKNGYGYNLTPNQILLVISIGKWNFGAPIGYAFAYYNCHGAQTRAEYAAYLERMTASLPASGTRLTGDWWDDENSRAHENE